MKLTHFVLMVAGTTTALMAGIFYAFSCAVNLGLGRLSDTNYLTAFQSINRTIQNPVFFVAFFGAPFFLSLSAWLQYSRPTSVRFWLLAAASLVYWVGAFGVTVLGNIPLNNQLDSLQLLSTSADELARQRAQFEGPWNRLNAVRSVASAAAMVLFILACLSPDEP
ncbi:DUF1772 domain-containing protein [Larkinella insperata]|uniref:DUF1772 domain-containing protein n=1 Tax=Larkinella insperata TaxID=332158 RepID=A0ABW3QMD9_9BACT|nr:anthrone oxygenase family protein [Larkinella insperata]